MQVASRQVGDLSMIWSVSLAAIMRSIDRISVHEAKYAAYFLWGGREKILIKSIKFKSNQTKPNQNKRFERLSYYPSLETTPSCRRSFFFLFFPCFSRRTTYTQIRSCASKYDTCKYNPHQMQPSFVELCYVLYNTNTYERIMISFFFFLFFFPPSHLSNPKTRKVPCRHTLIT